MALPKVICLLSHKCEPETHELGAALRNHLAEVEIDLLIDKFRVGDDVIGRMKSFDFDAFVFLLSSESTASRYCQIELETAKFRSVPFFVVQMGGAVPKEFENSAILRISSASDPNFLEKVCELARAMRQRVSFDKDIKLLRSDGTMVELQQSAQRLAIEADRTTIAEHVSELASVYNLLRDATSRYWVAITLGRAATPDAIAALKSFPTNDHPYARQGVKDALQMARGGQDI